MTRKLKPHERAERRGPPEKIEGDTLQKLEDAFSNSLPDREACIYARISPQTLYNYQKRHPEFVERKELLKLTPNIAARKTIVSNLGTPAIAQWWLTKKTPDEFGDKTKIEHAGKIQTEDVSVSVGLATALKQYEETRKKQIKEEARNMP